MTFQHPVSYPLAGIRCHLIKISRMYSSEQTVVISGNLQVWRCSQLFYARELDYFTLHLHFEERAHLCANFMDNFFNVLNNILQ